MATFTPEEVELMRTRGNYYCRRTWMALYDGIIPTDGIQDEQKVRDFMVDKYEKKRYYVEPDAAILKNGHNNQRPKLMNEFKQENSSATSKIINTTNNTTSKPLSINGIGRPENKNLLNSTRMMNGRNDFVADFAHADIFNAANNNNNNNVSNNVNNTTTNVSFANFDNNPVFNNTTSKEY